MHAVMHMVMHVVMLIMHMVMQIVQAAGAAKAAGVDRLRTAAGGLVDI